MNNIIALPKITVITVTYNGEETLENTITSVLNQTYKNIEYIIVDGESNDSTLEIIKKYDSIIWISEKDKGIYDAMNKGVNLATGDFIIFLGADDVFLDFDVVNRVVALGLKKDALNYGNVYFKCSSMIYFGKYKKSDLFHHNICHQSIFYPTNFLKQHSYDLQYKVYADWELNIKAISVLDMNYLGIPITIFNESGISSHVKDSFLKNRKKIIKEYFGILGLLTYFITNLRYVVRLVVKKIYYVTLIDK